MRERQVQAPRGIALLSDEVHAAVHGVGRFGKLIRQAGGQVGVSQQPTAGQLALGIGA